MKNDPIVAEIRRVRKAHAEEFNNDISAIVADIRRMEHESGREYVNFPPRRSVATGPTDRGTGGVTRR